MTEKTLNAGDRCDSCGAQAFVSVEFGDSGELLFCGHHFNKAEATIRSKASFVHDFRKNINTKPSVSANI